MKVAQLINPKEIILNEIQEPRIVLPQEVKIAIKEVTICGSDMRYFTEEKLPYGLKHPLILGHEAAGVICKVGKDSTFKIGDRVAIEPAIYCDKCRYCLSGKKNFCENLKFMASKGYHGSLQEKLVWPEKSVYKLPDVFSYKLGALLEPLSVAYSAVEKLKMSIINEQAILIIGAGSIGLFTAKLLNMIDSTIHLILLDNNLEKEQMIKKLRIKNATFCSSINNPFLPKLAAVIDTVASPRLLELILPLIDHEGKLVVIGVQNIDFSLNLKQLVYSGLSIIGSYRYQDTYPKLIELLTKHPNEMIEIEKIVTSDFPFMKTNEAFQLAVKSKKDLKVGIRF